MPDRAVRWTGGADVPSLVELLEASGVSAITAETQHLEVANRLERLRVAMQTANLPPAHAALVRQNAADWLKTAGFPSPVKFAEASLGGTKAAGATPALVLQDVEPWPEPVNGEQLFDELGNVFAGYVRLPHGGAAVLAAWVLFAHAHDAFQASPLLALVSPEKRCGKSRTLTVLMHLVPRPLLAANLTAASLFRAVERYRPTLLLDELDTFLHDDDGALRGVLNSGHARATAAVVRCEGDDHVPRLFSTWCPKALAQIGELPDTIEDRAVLVRLRRRRPDEAVLPLRSAQLVQELRPLAQRCARWVQDHAEELRTCEPEMPEGFADRRADTWAPLFAVADLASAAWGRGVRLAARALEDGADGGDGDGSVTTELLADIRSAFGDRERMTSEEMVGHLTQLEGRRWPEWRQGRPMTTNALARLVARFGIRPRVLRVGDRTPRGYERADFADAWSRYLPPEAQQAQQWLSRAVPGLSANRNGGPGVADAESPESPGNSSLVAAVADEEGGMGGCEAAP